MRSPGSWKDCGYDDSPPHKPHMALSLRAKQEIVAGALQVKMNELLACCCGPYRASIAEQDKYIEWQKGRLT